jgi:8-oxo-dGTP pyrophosphatase MutT (NUDIX family)
LVQIVQYTNQAAILIAINERDGVDQVLLTQRAAHLTLHGGEVAFPGGKWETTDSDLLETALRESHEEVGLAPDRVAVIEKLAASHTRGGIRVTPYVGRIESAEGLTANPDELESLFWVPIDFLLEDLRVRTDIFEFGGVEYWAPVYHFKGYEIWGFTSRVLIEFLNRTYHLKISREHPAKELRFRSG